MPSLITDQVEQILLAALYYVGIIVLVRLAGKRLAGQTTTFDLVVLIGLLVAMQQATLKEGATNGVLFIVTVLLMHRGLAMASMRWPSLKRFLRGAPRALIIDGHVSREAMADEGMGYDELLAGLRKLGYGSPEEVKLAMLEETGHISAVARDAKA
jgi:uncharacterized membrane protein YcaP (DUF421 family)